jgi:predicted nucleotide-binding protein
VPVGDVSRRVFVVHGRDDVLRSRMFDLLRALNLFPLEWEPIVAGGRDPLPFLNEVIARELDPGRVQAVLVLLTPEDIVHLHPALHEHDEQAHERNPVMQARPNVLVELGMALSSHRGRTVVVEVGRVRPAADLAGLNVIRFDGSPGSLKKVAERLKTAGCPVDDQGSDWLDPRRFAALDAYHRSVPVQEQEQEQEQEPEPDPDVF